MKRIIRSGPGGAITQEVTVTWEQHSYDCAKCRRVDTTKTATFVHACAEGSELLMEHAVDLQRPKQKKKEAEVREWAKNKGVFKL